MSTPDATPTRKIAPDVQFGENVKVYDFTNLYGCEIGDDTKIGTFVEIQKGASIGRACKISSHTFVCEGVTIEDNVFVGHGRETRRLDRVRRDVAVWNHDRRERHHWSGKRRHA